MGSPVRCLHILIYHIIFYRHKIFKLFAGSCERMQANELLCQQLCTIILLCAQQIYHQNTVITYTLFLCSSRYHNDILIKIDFNCTFLSDNSTFVSALKLYLAIASPISPICAGGGGLAGCAFSGGESFQEQNTNRF